jgi:hypothetical protein
MEPIHHPIQHHKRQLAIALCLEPYRRSFEYRTAMFKISKGLTFKGNHLFYETTKAECHHFLCERFGKISVEKMDLTNGVMDAVYNF